MSRFVALTNDADGAGKPVFANSKLCQHGLRQGVRGRLQTVLLKIASSQLHPHNAQLRRGGQPLTRRAVAQISSSELRAGTSGGEESRKGTRALTVSRMCADFGGTLRSPLRDEESIGILSDPRALALALAPTQSAPVDLVADDFSASAK